MNIVVTVKQVPEISEVQVNPDTGTLVREGVASILNPFCEYALDHAVRLKADHPGITITALTMGPPQARSVLLRAMELGADRGVLVTDRKFAGADSWVTALTLAASIRHAVPEFNLVFTGKQAIDGDTAQVGPELAEILNLPQISYGTAAELTARGICVTRETEAGYQKVDSRLPALVTFSKGETLRRAPSFADILAARKKSVTTIQAGDLDIPEEELGLPGSFTQVVSIFPPPAKTSGRLVSDLAPAEAGKCIAELIGRIGLLKKEASL